VREDTTIQIAAVLCERCSIASEPHANEVTIEARCNPGKRLKSQLLLRLDYKCDPSIHRWVDMEAAHGFSVFKLSPSHTLPPISRVRCSRSCPFAPARRLASDGGLRRKDVR